MDKGLHRWHAADLICLVFTIYFCAGTFLRENLVLEHE